MIVLDTHAWFWWTIKSPKLSKAARAAIEKQDHVGICAISLWELAMLVDRARIVLDRDVIDWMAQSLAQPGAELVALSPQIAAESTRLGKSFHGDPADRMIVATARLQGADLVTIDEKIHRAHVVNCVW